MQWWAKAHHLPGLRTFFIHFSLQDSVLKQLENYQNRIDDIFIPNTLLMVKAVSAMRGVSSSKAFRGKNLRPADLQAQNIFPILTQEERLYWETSR